MIGTVSEVASSGVSADTSSRLEVDVLIVGGGINGTGIARDLAGRGVKVLLVEADDLAAHTSSSSTKLIHGGLRYLESYEFSLVRKALKEREVLLRSAPHIMWPKRFVLPHDQTMRPAWMIRAGLFLYDHLASREVLPGSRRVDLSTHTAGAPLKDHFRSGFLYSDGWVDDARLVVLNAVDAAEHGAKVMTRTRCISAQRSEAGWIATLQNKEGLHGVSARALVNAAGPWAQTFLQDAAKPLASERLSTQSLRLVKGSHIVVRRLFEHDFAYILQTTDSRVLFAIPYERDYTLIGTTDVEVQLSSSKVSISEEEVAYLCNQVGRYFTTSLSPSDVVWSYAGVRPLLDDDKGDPSAVTRDYLLESCVEGPPLITVWGGKITTFRKLSEEAASMVSAMLSLPTEPWTANAKLPGGDLSAWGGDSGRPDRDFHTFAQTVSRHYSWLPQALGVRLARAYGSRIHRILGNAASLEGLGAEIAPALYEAELEYLINTEWAKGAEDVLWRRSRLGLHYSPAQRDTVEAWFRARASKVDQIHSNPAEGSVISGHGVPQASSSLL